MTSSKTLAPRCYRGNLFIAVNHHSWPLRGVSGVSDVSSVSGVSSVSCASGVLYLLSVSLLPRALADFHRPVAQVLAVLFSQRFQHVHPVFDERARGGGNVTSY